MNQKEKIVFNLIPILYLMYHNGNIKQIKYGPFAFDRTQLMLFKCIFIQIHFIFSFDFVFDIAK